jgi:UDP-glucose 4-epimerase
MASTKPSRGIVNSWRAEFGDAYVGRRVLVTGATGFIGGHLVDALRLLGAEVTGFSRSSNSGSLDCELLMVNLNDADAVRQAVAQIQPSIVFHLAGHVDGRQGLGLLLPTMRDNLCSTVHLLTALAEARVERVVVAGSSEEPVDGWPTSPYGAAKMASTLYTRLFQRVYGLPCVVARPFMSFGPRQKETKVIPYTVSSLLRGEAPVLSSGQRTCDFIYVLDVVRGLLYAALRSKLEGQTLDLGTGVGRTIRDVVMLAAELVDKGVQPVFSTQSVRQAELFRVADINQTAGVLGWRPQWSLEDALRETIAWYSLESVEQ